MILSGNFLGISVFEGVNPTPTKRAFSKIAFMGNNIITELKIQDIVLEDDVINNYTINNYNPQWDKDTILLAKFNNNIDGGNLITSGTVVNWDIYHREVGNTSLIKLATLDADTTEYVDYKVKANATYEHLIFPITTTQIGESIKTEPTLADFYGWYLIDVDTNLVYMFDLNLQSGDIQHNTDYTLYKNYTKYPSFSQLDTDYRTGSIKCIAGTINVNGELEQSVGYINTFGDFINNKKSKMLKSRKGDIFNVYTTDFNYKHMDELGEQVIEISFNFTEVGSVEI